MSSPKSAASPATHVSRPLEDWSDPTRSGEDVLAAIAEGRLSVAHRLWPRARAGDDAAAVGIALDLLEIGRDGPDLHLAMWTLRHLAGWNAAARLVLAHGSRKFARRS